MEKIPMTTYGYAKLEEELKHRIRIERPSIIDDIAEARAHGDLSENAEYHAAKEKQGINEAVIKDLEAKLSLAERIDPTTMSGSRVTIGATVEVVDVDSDEEKTYILVGPSEADIDKGLISITSPLGRALISKEEGDEAVFKAPGGVHTYEILNVKFQEINV